jgi:hypothetical protein
MDFKENFDKKITSFPTQNEFISGALDIKDTIIQ